MSDTSRFKFKFHQSELPVRPALGEDPGYDSYCQMLAEFKRDAYHVIGEGLMPISNPEGLPPGAPKLIPIVAVSPITGKGDGGRFARLRQKIFNLMMEAHRNGTAGGGDFMNYTYYLEFSISKYFDDKDYVHLRLVYAPPIKEEIAVLFELPKNLQALKLLYKNRVLFITNELPQPNAAATLKQIPLSVEFGDDVLLPKPKNVRAPLVNEFEGDEGSQFGIYRGLPPYESLGTVLEFEEAKQLAKTQWELHRN